MDEFPLIEEVFRPLRIASNVVRFEPSHLGSAVVTTRIFGGQTLAQIQLAVELLYPDSHVLSVRTTFVSSGHVKIAIDCVVDRIPETPFLNVTLYQNDKIMATAKVKIGSADAVLTATCYRMPAVKKPLSYPSLAEKLKNSVEKGFGYYLVRKIADWDLLDVRPVDFTQMVFEADELEPFVVWSTLTEKQKSKKLPKSSGKAILAMMSDFWSMHSSCENFAKYDPIGESFPPSLNHNFTFHTTDTIDPCGWFLTRSECRIHSNNRFLMEGQIFDVSGRCVLSFEQEGYKP